MREIIRYVDTMSETHNVDVLSTKDGPITFIWPKKLSPGEAELLCDFLDLSARAMALQVERNERRFTGFDHVDTKTSPDVST